MVMKTPGSSSKDNTMNDASVVAANQLKEMVPSCIEQEESNFRCRGGPKLF